jgi:hypothetical protein
MRPEQPHSPSSRRALARQATITADTREKPRLTQRDLGNLLAARDLLEQTLTARRRVLGDAHPDTQESIKNLDNIRRELGEL